MPVPGRALTLQDLFAQLANNAGQSIALNSSEVLNQLLSDSETLLLNVSGSPPTFTTGTNYPVLILGDYPTSYWRLAEAAAVGIAYDSNQNAYSIYPRIASSSLTTVTQGAASFYTAGVAATLTATSSAISFANGSSLQITTDLTMELWVKFSSSGTNGTSYALLVKGAGSSAGEYELYVNSNGTVLTPSFRQNNGFTTLNATSTLSTGTWYHLALVRNSAGNTTTLYINGVAAGSTTYTAATTTTGNVLIGATGTFNALAGSYTEAALYHKALASTQIAAHHAWGVASDVTATPYGGTSATYAGFAYPASSPPTSASYGSGTTWGTFVWQ